jgi:hypothetical protein
MHSSWLSSAVLIGPLNLAWNAYCLHLYTCTPYRLVVIDAKCGGGGGDDDDDDVDDGDDDDDDRS